MSIRDWYQEASRNCGIQRGDVVRVTEIVRSGHNGWGNSWGSGMNDFVGNTYNVMEVDHLYGYSLREQPNGRVYQFPFYVLEKQEISNDIGQTVTFSADTILNPSSADDDALLVALTRYVETANTVASIPGRNPVPLPSYWEETSYQRPAMGRQEIEGNWTRPHPGRTWAQDSTSENQHE